jgi:cell division protease FtsH
MDEKLEEFGELFRRFLKRALDEEPEEEPEFKVLLREHLGAEPSDLPIVAESVSAWDHANLQLGLEALLEEEGRSATLVGIGGGHKRYMELSLSDLVGEHYRVGSVEYDNVAVGPGRTHACILFGLALVRTPEGPVAILVRQAEQNRPGAAALEVELMTPVDGLAPRLLAELRERMRERNVFRGQLVSFEGEMWGGVNVVFHERPTLRRDQVVLPERVLHDVERHLIGIGRRAESLRAAGQHLKRGLLLHGPPGTGKTHTVRWITAEVADATVIVLSGGSLGVAGPVCRLARELTPSIVVLEDVDLVASERMLPHGGGSLLFELLNELDGMADDADVAVVLTTNRPDLLEPALAARPGRVDLAVEVPLPDEDCRRRLFDLYASGLELDGDGFDSVVERTAGVTASFFRELLRQAALEAAEAESPKISAAHVDAALDRMLSQTNTLTQILLGGAAARERGSRSAGATGWLEGVQFRIEG